MASPSTPLLLSLRAQVQGFGDWKGTACGVGSGSCTPAGCVGSVVTQPFSVSVSSIIKWGPLPSHKAIVEITGPILPVPACLRFSLSEVFLPSFLPGQLLVILQKVWAQCHLLQEALPGHWFLRESLFGVGLPH